MFKNEFLFWPTAQFKIEKILSYKPHNKTRRVEYLQLDLVQGAIKFCAIKWRKPVEARAV